METPPAAATIAARAVPVGLLAAAAWATAWFQEGSIAAEDWLPYAVLAALAVAAVLFSGGAARPRGIALAAVGATLALAAWAALSAGWSPVPALARDEALLTAFYAAALAIPLLTLRTEIERLTALGVVAAAMAALALTTAAVLLFGGDTLDRYDDGRLNFPIAYANGQAAMFLVAFWPAIVVAARRTLPAVVRALALAGAVALLAGELLAQSKGGAIALGVSAVAVFALSPHRLRLLVPPLAAALLALAAAAPLTGPFRAEGEDATRDAIRSAGATVLVLAAAAFAVGLLYALADRRVHVSERARRRAGAAALAALAAAAIAAPVAFFATVERPGHFFEEKWRNFKRLPDRERTQTHLLSLGSNRYDFWRVGLNELREHPIAGVGARGFGAIYLQEGWTDETPARAHSLPVETLAEEGVVGFLLLAAALGIPLAAAVVRARDGRTSAVAAVGAGTYFVAHAGVDWIWTFPAVGVVAFCLLGIGIADGDEAGLPRRAQLVGGGAAVAVALVVFAPPWLSAKLSDRALEATATPEAELRWARRLDPLSTEPLVVESALARTPAEAIPPLENAVRKEPRSAALRYLLGVTYLDAGRRRDAVRTLSRAQELAPHDRFIAQALERAQRAAERA